MLLHSEVLTTLWIDEWMSNFSSLLAGGTVHITDLPSKGGKQRNKSHQKATTRRTSKDEGKDARHTFSRWDIEETMPKPTRLRRILFKSTLLGEEVPQLPTNQSSSATIPLHLASAANGAVTYRLVTAQLQPFPQQFRIIFWPDTKCLSTLPCSIKMFPCLSPTIFASIPEPAG